MPESSRADVADRLATLERRLREAHLELRDARGGAKMPRPAPRPAAPDASRPASASPARRSGRRRRLLPALAAGSFLLVLGGGAALLVAGGGGDSAAPGERTTVRPRTLPAPAARAAAPRAATRLVAPLGGCVELAEARALARRPGRLDAMRRRAARRGARRALARLRRARPRGARSARTRSRVARVGAAAGVARFDARRLLLPVAVRDRPGACVAPSRAAIAAGRYPLVAPAGAGVRTVAIARAP
jgi:hypothetical protein